MAGVSRFRSVGTMRLRSTGTYSLALLLAGTGALGSTSLAACSSDDPATPADAGATDSAPTADAAEPEDPKREAGADAGSAIPWKTCVDKRFECATVDLPLDYDDPGLGKVSIALQRRRAATLDRVGVLFVNPGGPGGPVLAQVGKGFPALLGTGTLLADRFDLVAMDPRGVGKSSPIDCFTDPIAQALLAMPSVPKNDTEWTTLFAATSQVGPSCKAKVDPKLLARMDTATVAKDMDAVRALLGEETINYLGYSYGTYLGAVYATLFPKRVRAFVLDSPILFASDHRDLARAVTPALDDSLQQFFAWCATSPKCTFGPATGRTADSIAAAYDDLVVKLDATPLANGARPLDGGGVRFATQPLLMSPAPTWETLGKGLAAAATGDASVLGPILTGSAAPQDPASRNLFSTFIAIEGAESPVPKGVSQGDIRAFIEGELKALGPRVGVAAAANDITYFVDWPVTLAHPVPPVNAKDAPPLLVVANRHDPATAYSWAAKMMTALDNGSHLLTYEGAGHTQSSAVPCLGIAIGTYLVDPSKPPVSTSCAAQVP